MQVILTLEEFDELQERAKQAARLRKETDARHQAIARMKDVILQGIGCIHDKGKGPSICDCCPLSTIKNLNLDKAATTALCDRNQEYSK